MRPHIVASHLGVSPESYLEYETGQTLIPAEHLAELARLLRVPMFYFFRDVPIADDKTAAESKPTPAFSVTTETDRIVALVGDFQKLDFERQQHLLLLAGALVRDSAAR
jgi:transcriptional regulator with XRE-family HTH domain